MKTVLTLLTAVWISTGLYAQNKVNVNDLKPAEDYDNIQVQKINNADDATSFIIWVKKNVRLHKHEAHTENLYVLEGEGKMTVGDTTFMIKPGDYFQIPKNTPHAVVVLSKKPLKVISVQAPEFKGKDRIFIED